MRTEGVRLDSHSVLAELGRDIVFAGEVLGNRCVLNPHICRHRVSSDHPQQCAQLTAFDRQVSCVARLRNVRDPRLWVSSDERF
jgi:hypothetical protein